MAIFLTSGCASDSGGGKDGQGLGFVPNVERARYKNLNVSGVDIIPFDLNNDQKPDQWKVMSGERLLRVERDLNFDGRVDAYVYKTEGGEVFEESVHETNTHIEPMQREDSSISQERQHHCGSQVEFDLRQKQALVDQPMQQLRLASAQTYLLHFFL